MKVIRYIITGVVTIIISIISIFFSIVDCWLLLIPEDRRYYTADKFLIIPWTILVNNLIGIRMKIIGKEYVDRKRTTLYICNHQSWVDIPTFLRYSRAPTVAKKEVRKIPFLGLLIIYAGGLFFDRNDRNGRLSVVRDTMKILKRGDSFCLFPEGTRSKNGELLEPNLAILKVCYKLGVPVVPSAIEGTRNILERGNYYINLFKKVVLKYNPPLYPKDYKNDEEFANACWDVVKESHNEIKAYFNTR